MTGHVWYDRFVAAGPDYPAGRMAVAELQALLLKAGTGAELPLGHAEDLSALAPLLMSDPQLLAMAAAALDGPHTLPRVEGTEDHVVIEQGSTLMVGSAVVDALVCGAKRVILHKSDWPLLLWPILAHASKVYGVRCKVSSGAKDSVTITAADGDGLDPFGAPQPVPRDVADRLRMFAARTYVPSSEASRVAGAGAGLTDND